MESALHRKLAEHARRGRKRQGQLRWWRIGASLPSVCRYLFWRNRYPLLTRLLSRGFLFLELYLLLSIFHTGVAAVLSGLLFTLYLAQQLFQGVVQQYRVHLAAALQLGRLHDAKHLCNALARLSLLFAAVVAVLLFVVIQVFAEDPLFRFLATLLLILLPAQLWSSTLWSALYAFHRLPRNFFVILILRAIPSLSLLLFGELLGPKVYGVALCVARLTEAIYLAVLARAALENIFQDLPDSEEGQQKGLLLPGERREFIERVGFFALPAIYHGTVALSLFATHDFYWVTYFAFFFFLTTLLYLPLRFAQSLAMDIYLALRSASVHLARQFMRLALYSSIFALVFTAALFLLALSILSNYLVFQAPFLWRLSGYAFLLLVVRGFFFIGLTLVRAACLERAMLWPHIIAFLTASGFQIWGILFERADLNYVYFVESILFATLAVITLGGRKKLSASPIFTGATRRHADRVVLPPILWLQNTLTLSEATKKYGSIQVDPAYRSRQSEEVLVKRLLERHPKSEVFFTRIVPGYLFFAMNSEKSAEQLERSLIAAAVGFVRSVVVFSEEKEFEQEYTRTLNSFRKTREYHRWIGSALNRAHSRPLRAIMGEQPLVLKSSAFSPGHRNFIPLPDNLQSLPSVSIGWNKIVRRGKLSDSFQLFVSERLARSIFTRSMVPGLKGNGIVLSCFGIPLLMLDCSKAEPAQREFGMDFSLYFTLAVAKEILKDPELAKRFLSFCGISHRQADPAQGQTEDGQVHRTPEACVLPE